MNNNKRSRILSFIAVFTLAVGLFAGFPIRALAAPGDYNSGDIAVINAMIDNNGLDWTKANPIGDAIPGDWQVVWSADQTDKRIVRLFILDQSPLPITGVLDFTGLSELFELTVTDASLTGLNVSGLINLEELFCHDTGISSLDVSGCAALTNLACDRNMDLSTLTLGIHNDLTQINALNCPNLTGTIDASGCPLLNILQIGNTVAFPAYPLGSPISRLILYGGYNINFNVSPVGSGTVRVMSNGVFGSAPIALFATPNTGNNFVGWTSSGFISNAPSGTASPIQFYRYNVPASSSVVTANFSIPYGITLSESGTYDFGTVTESYSPVTAHSVTVTNVGTQATGTLNVGLSGANSGSFSLSTSSISSINAGGTDNFTIKPNDNLPTGTYATTVTVSGGNGITASFDVSFSINAMSPPTSYTISIGNFAGGSVSANRSTATAGENVILTISPENGYELDEITVHRNSSSAMTVALRGTGSTRSFAMPAYNVTVSATFKKTAAQSLWEKAREIIENAVYVVSQEAANTEDEVCAYLADYINNLLKDAGIGLTVTCGDIWIQSSFTSAVAGVQNGTFSFFVMPQGVYGSNINNGVIVATTVGNEQLTPNNEQLKGYVQNGLLYVSGLTVGQMWSVYNILGALIYKCIVTDVGARHALPLPGRGVYIVQSENSVIKITN